VIAYFDTSAVVPLLIAEPGSAQATQLWNEADRVVSARLIYPEGRAALAQANRLGRLTGRQLRVAVSRLDTRCEQLDIVDIDEQLARQAGDLAEAHGLRGYDAVHLAAANRVADGDLVLVAGDRPILAAAASAGLMTAAIG
jgi:predicted nucleic acid-binding protein